MKRRTFIKQGSAMAALAALPAGLLSACSDDKAVAQALRATEFSASLLGADGPTTTAWGYGTIPGPVLRYKQGVEASLQLINNLEQDTTVHWHGLRIPAAMDGVPYLTQNPVKKGEAFDYRFPLKDAGTYWYHPHVNSDEQVGRGLSGAFIVEEETPPVADRDIVWLLDDWRLDREGQIVPFGGNLHDAAHAGRFGNVVTINGELEEDLQVTSGERIRLRLINAANARIFGLKFDGHVPVVIARDGHPVDPYALKGLAILPPGARLDLMIDMTAAPGKIFNIIDEYYQRFAYAFSRIVYADAAPVRKEALPKPERLPPNPVSKPDLAKAEMLPLVLGGGAMGGMAEARYRGEMKGLRELAGMGMVWAFNGEIIPHMTKDDIGKPVFDLKLGKTYRIRITNSTAFDHPIHLHGHTFHLIASGDETFDDPHLLDTVLVRPRSSVEVAFVADNPGNWAFHCHVLEHAAAGMMGYVKIG